MEAWVIATEAEEEKNGNPKKRESRNEERETIIFLDGIVAQSYIIMCYYESGNIWQWEKSAGSFLESLQILLAM